MDRLIAPQCIKQGIFRCLKAGVNAEFPEQGTPQGTVVSPLLANIALHGIEDIHPSVRYAEDMIYFVRKGKHDPKEILNQVEEFLKQRGMNISKEKTKITASTDGFDFLGWNFKVQINDKVRSTPSEENFKNFRGKIKTIIKRTQDSPEEKVRKLAPLVRGWRKYHQYCKMRGSRHNLHDMQLAAYRNFLRKNKKIDRYQAKRLLDRAFPTVEVKQYRFVGVTGNKSPYDGDLIYWSKRKSKLFDNHTARTLKRQKNLCAECGLTFWDEEEIHLHHVDGNHTNWKWNNLLALHRSCHMKVHRQKKTKV